MKTEILLKKPTIYLVENIPSNSMQADESEEYSWLICIAGKVTITSGFHCS
jgi:hypothetical protein